MIEFNDTLYKKNVLITKKNTEIFAHIKKKQYFCTLFRKKCAQVAELVDALVSNTNGKPCRFDPGPGYKKIIIKVKRET